MGLLDIEFQASAHWPCQAMEAAKRLIDLATRVRARDNLGTGAIKVASHDRTTSWFLQCSLTSQLYIQIPLMGCIAYKVGQLYTWFRQITDTQ